MGLRTAIGLRKKRPKMPTHVMEAFFGKTFTSDWATGSAPHWQGPLQSLPHTSPKILEIGSYEGRSAIIFLAMRPDADITCIDSFRGGREERFDSNVAEFGARVEKIKGFSSNELPRLIAAGRKFDVVYIDGDHTRKGVLQDSILCWLMLNKGGILIWDDYRWGKRLPIAGRPKHAIDLFIDIYGDELQVLHKDFQVIVRRE